MLKQYVFASYACGAVSGVWAGYRDCQLSEQPMIHERMASGLYVGLMWGSGAMFSPVVIPVSLLRKWEKGLRGEDCGILDYFKVQKKIGTGSRF